LAREAAEGGADIVAAVGGDGTCNEVVNGLFDGMKPRRRAVIFAVIPWGTGGDLARSLKAPSRLRDALWTAATGMTLPADVGHVRFVDHSGAQAERVFLNVAGFGANGEVVSRANKSSKRLGGGVTFLSATVAKLGTYQPPAVEIRWTGEDGGGKWRGDLLSAFVANAHYCGGGMHVGKGGSMHDGRFDLSILPPMSPARAIRHARRLYDGSLERMPGVVRVDAPEVEARPVDPEARVLLDIDGEQPGRLPATFRILPRTIQVRGGWLRSPLLDGDNPTWRPGATRR
jgi:diacylglycerol kinase family enzyme